MAQSYPPESWPQSESTALKVLRPLIYFVGRILLFLLGRVRVEGKAKMPATGGVLVVANHLSDLDPIVLQASARRHLVYMAKSELFEMPSISRMLKLWMSFPVQRGEPDRAALKHAIAMLQAGHVVCIFPEGQLSQSTELLPILPGAALIARQTGVPVIAAGIWGTQFMMPYGRLVPRPAWGRVSVRWGSPRAFSKSDKNEDVTAWIQSELRTLRK